MYKYSFSLYSTTKSTISKMDIYKNYALNMNSDNFMLQPFATLKSPCKNNTSHCPVCKHTDPDSHRSKSQSSDKKYTQTESADPHRTAGCDHGKFYIACSSKPISGYNLQGLAFTIEHEVKVRLFYNISYRMHNSYKYPFC